MTSRYVTVEVYLRYLKLQLHQKCENHAIVSYKSHGVRYWQLSHELRSLLLDMDSIQGV